MLSSKGQASLMLRARGLLTHGLAPTGTAAWLVETYALKLSLPLLRLGRCSAMMGNQYQSQIRHAFRTSRHRVQRPTSNVDSGVQ